MTLASPNSAAASICALAMPFPVQAQTLAHIGHLQQQHAHLHGHVPSRPAAVSVIGQPGPGRR